MLSEDEKKLLKIFKAQVEKEETEYFSVNVYTQLLYDSHKTVLNIIKKLQKENEEKDKQIDLILKEQIEDGYLVNFHNLEEAREYYKRIAKEKGEN